MVIQWFTVDIVGEGMRDTELTEGTGAGDSMPMVRITEMYDMSTVRNRIGVIGIHTPTAESVDVKWHGYFLNHKFWKPVACDVSIACASMLPLDPLGVGVEPGKVAPQDMMNPMLYRAVSNDSWNMMVNRLYSLNSTGGDGVDMDRNSIRVISDALPSITNADQQDKMYYSMLASNEWRKALPQSGLEMRGLRPLVYPIVSNLGQGVVSGLGATGVNTASQSTTAQGNPGSSNASASNSNSNRFFRGSAQPAPRFPCTTNAMTTIYDESGNTPLDKYQTTIPAYPRIYVGCIVMPPARLQAMYYRLKVSWLVSFEEPVSVAEKRASSGLIDDSEFYYGRTYDFSQSSKLADADASAVDTNTIDTIGLEPELVMDK